MEQKDLQLFDYYKSCKNILMQVLNIDDLADSDEFEPLEITPEILEKFNFGAISDSNIQLYNGPLKIENLHIHIELIAYNYNKHSLCINCTKCEVDEDNTTVIDQFDNNILIKCNYVHEFQHALRLAGLENIANICI